MIDDCENEGLHACQRAAGAKRRLDPPANHRITPVAGNGPPSSVATRSRRPGRSTAVIMMLVYYPSHALLCVYCKSMKSSPAQSDGGARVGA